jgi:paired amphipathic helix protein Sin3a
MGRGSEDDMGMRAGGGSLEKELMYFDRVKTRLRNKEAYQDFLKCLHLFATDIISRSELIQLASVRFYCVVSCVWS